MNAALMYAAPTHQALPGTAGGLLRVTLALVVVLAAVFAAAWLSRRLRGAGGARSSALSVLAQVSLGPRERAVLVRVGTRQVLVGVAQGCVATLHVLSPEETGVAVDGADGPGAAPGGEGGGPVRPSFRALLLKSLGK